MYKEEWNTARWSALVTGVSDWAVNNFGVTQVRSSTTLMDTGEDLVQVPIIDINNPDDIPTRITDPGLYALAPILGLGEEIGEFGAARSREDTVDAVGDIVIYACDAMGRLQVDVPQLMTICTKFRTQLDSTLTAHLAVAHGRLCHTILKRAQGIRGMDDYANYRPALHNAFAHLLWAVNDAAAVHARRSALEVGEAIFHKVVSKRNWKVQPDAAS